MKEYTIKQIREKIEVIVDPVNSKTLKETSSIKHIGINPEENLVILVIVITKINGLEEKAIKRKIAKIIKLDLGFDGVKIQFEERRIIESITNRNIKFILVQSGKGGVGKSTVSANLAYSLTRLNKKVALIDADIYGSSIPKILEMEHHYPKTNKDGKILPFSKYNMEIISTEFFAEEGKPVIWRGAMLNSMITNFFYEVCWNKDLDYVIVDCPPGTGDVSLNLKSIIPTAKVLIVTTPHKQASHVAIKAAYAALQMKHQIIGVVENMSYFKNPANNNKEYIFGSGGGENVASLINTELLASIPIGQPKYHFSLFESDEEIGQIYDNLAILITLHE